MMVYRVYTDEDMNILILVKEELIYSLMELNLLESTAKIRCIQEVLRVAIQILNGLTHSDGASNCYVRHVKKDFDDIITTLYGTTLKLDTVFDRNRNESDLNHAESVRGVSSMIWSIIQ